ncbi:hypothetical protein ACWDZ5_06885 [Streptomyces sp. NPDC002996]
MARPVTTRLTLPADDPIVVAGGPLSVELSSPYNIDGTLQNTTEPALGGLLFEIVQFGYTGLGQVTSIGGSTGCLLRGLLRPRPSPTPRPSEAPLPPRPSASPTTGTSVSPRRGRPPRSGAPTRAR